MTLNVIILSKTILDRNNNILTYYMTSRKNLHDILYSKLKKDLNLNLLNN